MIAVGIVLFNPDNIERFLSCIEMARKQIDTIYIFDNSTKKIDISFPKNIIYISEGKNKGVAYALNRIMEKAEADGFSWVVTMDQDSVLPLGMIDDFSKYIFIDNKIGIICPQVIDSRRSYMSVNANNSEMKYISFCITSGSCTSISAWKAIGKFDEWLFVDLVDNEFCKRLTVSGYKILQIEKWILNQEFGNIVPKPKRQQEFWLRLSQILHNQNIAKFSYKKSVSPLRVYYTNRNIIYVNRKLKKYGPIGYRENYNCNGYLGFLFSFCLPSLLRAENKRKVFTAICKGIVDGKKAKVECWIIGEM